MTAEAAIPRKHGRSKRRRWLHRLLFALPLLLILLGLIAAVLVIAFG